MTYLEDLLRLRDQQIKALQDKITELEAKMEVTLKQLETYVNN